MRRAIGKRWRDSTTRVRRGASVMVEQAASTHITSQVLGILYSLQQGQNSFRDEVVACAVRVIVVLSCCVWRP